MHKINVRDLSSCEAQENETILSALTRAGIAVSAPCGGRGICGNCGVFLLEGKILLNGKELESGGIFPSCRGMPISDITIEIPAENTGIINAFKKEKTKRKKIIRAGAALDLGTTTVQLELVDLDTGESLETLSALNAQRNFGADVMSRINAARNGKTKELFSAINRQIEDMLKHCISEWNLSGIEQCNVSGNTTMLHLFCGVNPGGMGEVPFTPVFLEERFFTGPEIGLSAGKITLLPGISAFVGADIVSGLAFLDILNHRENTLLADIGTNGEIALWRKNEQRLLCASTAAGPCFEGAEISCGMGATTGAINHIYINGKPAAKKNETIFNSGLLSFTTLENIQPRGVCGSGLIDALAAMIKLGAIDETGALTEEFAEKGFPLTGTIFLTQKDIRQFQLAKSAIFSGITVLGKRAGLGSLLDIETVYIAGGLGFFVNLENSVTAGLLPAEFSAEANGKSRTAVCGNTSLKGAVQSLLNPEFLTRCKEIVLRSDTADLAAAPDFSEAFAENMYF